uniref:Dehydrogenase/reductase SDR family member 2 n=1 Tax=Sciurus vulgaris TaxID=55149 RepID=A0A8D2AHQ5_SCIVU
MVYNSTNLDHCILELFSNYRLLRSLWCFKAFCVFPILIILFSICRIGFAIARRLAQNGAHVVICSRKQHNVDQAVATLQREGLSVTGTVCHVGKAEDREKLVATALEHSKGIDFLVCVAGVNPLVGSTLGSSEQVWDKLFSVSFRFGEPEDCAGIVSFLCSSDASYITGENITVAGYSPNL